MGTATATAVPFRVRSLGFLLVLVVAFLGGTLAQTQTRAYALNERTIFKAVLSPKSLIKVGSMTGPWAVVTTAGIIGWELFGDDVIEWATDTYNGFFGNADQLGTWVYPPTPTTTAGPAHRSLGDGTAAWRADFGTRDSLMYQGGGVLQGVPITVVQRCISTAGKNWEHVSQQQVNWYNESFFSQPDQRVYEIGSRTACAQTPAGPEFAGDGSAGMVDAVTVTQDAQAPNGAPAGRVMEWAAATPKLNVYAETRCRQGLTVTSGTSAMVSQDLGSTVTVPRDGCDSILPGGYAEKITVHGGIEQVCYAGNTGSCIVLAQWELADGAAASYPDCMTPTAGCQVKEVTDLDTGDKTCYWGPYIIPPGDCENVPDVEPEPTPDPTPSANPPPREIPVPIMPPGLPAPSGVPSYGSVTNPDGSVTQTWTYPNGTTVTNTTRPDGTVDVVHTPGNGTAPTTHSYPPEDTAEETGGDCFGEAITLTRPWTWVYGPVKCALVWAFVPSPATVARLTQAGDVAADTIPFSWFGDMGTWLADATDVGSSCLSLGAEVGPFGQVTMLDSCTPGPVEGIVMSYRGLLSVVLYITVIAPLLWWAWRAYAPASTASA